MSRRCPGVFSVRILAITSLSHELTKSPTETCDHSFCLACIRQWRSMKDKPLAQLQASETCPTCRRVCKFVAPSRCSIGIAFLERSYNLTIELLQYLPQNWSGEECDHQTLPREAFTNTVSLSCSRSLARPSVLPIWQRLPILPCSSLWNYSGVHPHSC